jgi:hypothetical protein
MWLKWLLELQRHTATCVLTPWIVVMLPISDLRYYNDASVQCLGSVGMQQLTSLRPLLPLCYVALLLMWCGVVSLGMQTRVEPYVKCGMRRIGGCFVVHSGNLKEIRDRIRTWKTHAEGGRPASSYTLYVIPSLLCLLCRVPVPAWPYVQLGLDGIFV